MNNRIKFAYHLHGWEFDPSKKIQLRQKAQKVLPEEYQPEMGEHLFCPECCSPLYRSPKDKPISKTGKVFFAHKQGTKEPCGLRIKKALGKTYLNEEDAKQAIQSEELVVVAGFLNIPPETPISNKEEYDLTNVEEKNGPDVVAPIARHNGENLVLPSKFKTIRGITRNFDENIHRYFFMPRGQYAVQLQDLFINVANVKSTDNEPRLYYGKITRSKNAGKKPSNIRMTWLEYDKDESEYADFCFKLSDEDQQEKGIDDSSSGRVLIVYGKVTENGAGLCIEKSGWGEFALLPQKYEKLIS